MFFFVDGRSGGGEYIFGIWNIDFFRVFKVVVVLFGLRYVFRIVYW